MDTPATLKLGPGPACVKVFAQGRKTPADLPITCISFGALHRLSRESTLKYVGPDPIRKILELKISIFCLHIPTYHKYIETKQTFKSPIHAERRFSHSSQLVVSMVLSRACLGYSILALADFLRARLFPPRPFDQISWLHSTYSMYYTYVNVVAHCVLLESRQHVEKCLPLKGCTMFPLRLYCSPRVL